jgi:hypothetical protein
MFVFGGFNGFDRNQLPLLIYNFEKNKWKKMEIKFNFGYSSGNLE